MGHVAVVRGDRRGPGLGVRPDAGRRRASRRPALGHVQARGGRRRLRRPAPLPDRGQRPTAASTASRPTAYPTLDAGVLEVAVVAADGAVTWARGARRRTRRRPRRRRASRSPGATRFARGEGIWFDSRRRLPRDDGRHEGPRLRHRRASASRSIYDRETIAGRRRSPTPDNVSRLARPATSSSARTATARTALDVALLTPDLTVSRVPRARSGRKHVYDEPEPRRRAS